MSGNGVPRPRPPRVALTAVPPADLAAQAQADLAALSEEQTAVRGWPLGHVPPNHTSVALTLMLVARSVVCPDAHVPTPESVYHYDEQGRARLLAWGVGSNLGHAEGHVVASRAWGEAYLAGFEALVAAFAHYPGGVRLAIPDGALHTAIEPLVRAWPWLDLLPFHDDLKNSPVMATARRAAIWAITGCEPQDLVGQVDAIKGPKHGETFAGARSPATSVTDCNTGFSGATPPPAAASTQHTWDHTATVHVPEGARACDVPATVAPGLRRSAIIAATDGSAGHQRGIGSAYATNDGHWESWLYTGSARAGRAEMRAINGLLIAAPPDKPMIVLVDSQEALHLVAEIRSMPEPPTKEWSRLRGFDLRTACGVWRGIAARTAPLEMRWVRGHSGHPLNDLADRLALQTRRGPSFGLTEDQQHEILARIAQDGFAHVTGLDQDALLEGSTPWRTGHSPATAYA